MTLLRVHIDWTECDSRLLFSENNFSNAQPTVVLFVKNREGVLSMSRKHPLSIFALFNPQTLDYRVDNQAFVR
jgi:hypothetical protein